MEQTTIPTDLSPAFGSYPHLLMRLLAVVNQDRRFGWRERRDFLLATAWTIMSVLGAHRTYCFVAGGQGGLCIDPGGRWWFAVQPPLGAIIIQVPSVEPESSPAPVREKPKRRRPPQRRKRRRRVRLPLPPEPRTGKGQIRLTRSRLALLQGLLDRPRGVASSKRDLAQAALPYMPADQRSHLALYYGIDRLHPAWVQRRAAGGRIEVKLLPRGRAILDGKVPAYVVGEGPYRPRSVP